MRSLLLAILLASALAACASQPVRSTDPMFKGVELYSWADAPGTSWRFVLLPGTNRRKAAAEVMAAPGVLRSWPALKERIALLAPGEEVFWLVPATGGFALPPAADVDALVSHAAARGVRIHLPPR